MNYRSSSSSSYFTSNDSVLRIQQQSDLELPYKGSSCEDMMQFSVNGPDFAQPTFAKLPASKTAQPCAQPPLIQQTWLGSLDDSDSAFSRFPEKSIPSAIPYCTPLNSFLLSNELSGVQYDIESAFSRFPEKSRRR